VHTNWVIPHLCATFGQLEPRRCDSSFSPTCSRMRPCSNGLIRRLPLPPPLVDVVRAEARLQHCARRVCMHAGRCALCSCQRPSRSTVAAALVASCSPRPVPVGQAVCGCSQGEGCGRARVMSASGHPAGALACSLQLQCGGRTLVLCDPSQQRAVGRSQGRSAELESAVFAIFSTVDCLLRVRSPDPM
jgi:hypothetical protein